MSTKVGDLRAELGIEDREFDRGLKSAERRYQQTKTDVEKDPVKPKVDGKEAEKGFDGVLKGIAGAAAAGAAGCSA